MYAYIQGKLIVKCPTFVVIEAGGIGYHIHISLHTYSNIAQQGFCKLFTWLHVKEDAHMLYGFLDESERNLFLHLISVAGIGPSTGRMILSSITPAEIQEAIVKGNALLIQKIKGIGPKAAQRIVLELQDKLKKEGAFSLVDMPTQRTGKDEALSALITLGFARNPAEKVLDQIMDSEEGLQVEQLIKAALQKL